MGRWGLCFQIASSTGVHGIAQRDSTADVAQAAKVGNIDNHSSNSNTLAAKNVLFLSSIASFCSTEWLKSIDALANFVYKGLRR